MPQAPLAVIVLAAGKGTRMKSRRAKVLHEVAGRSLVEHVLVTAEALQPQRLFVVVVRDGDEVREALAGRAEFVDQPEQLGTGHAVAQVEPHLRDFAGDVLVLYADVPLLRRESLEALRSLRSDTGADLVMLTSPDPLPGIVIRDAQGRVERIVERTDATAEQAKIREGNTGVYLMSAATLRDGLARLDDSNAQGELYLTDVVGHAVSSGRRVDARKLDDPSECLGVNDRSELAEAAYVLRMRKVEELMAAGVTVVDPEQTYVDVQVEVGRDSLIEPGCVLQGETVLGEGVHLKPHCTIESSRIADDAVIGPCAHLRPGSQLMEGVRIGNFVEVKNSVLGRGVKVDHLSYVGDADVGEGSSFGCGSITVNYDWEAKHRTKVGRGTKIGCNANLVAPIEIGDGVAVAAGSTLTRDVPDDALAVARARQRNVEGWVARRQGRAPAAPRTPQHSAASKPARAASDGAAAKAGVKAAKVSAREKGKAEARGAARPRKKAAKTAGRGKRPVSARKAAATKKEAVSKKKTASSAKKAASKKRTTSRRKPAARTAKKTQRKRR